MNLEKYNHAFLVEVKGICKDITKWSYEEGELDESWCADSDFISGKAVFDKATMQNPKRVRSFIESVIKESLYIDNLESSDLYIYGYESQAANVYLSVRTIEDVEGYIVEDYEESQQELFMCDYTLLIKINGVPIWGNDLKEIFDNVCVF